MSEDSIFGTPPEPENDAEAQAERDWLDGSGDEQPDPPETATPEQLDSASEEVVGVRGRR